MVSTEWRWTLNQLPCVMWKPCLVSLSAGFSLNQACLGRLAKHQRMEMRLLEIYQIGRSCLKLVLSMNSCIIHNFLPPKDIHTPKEEPLKYFGCIYRILCCDQKWMQTSFACIPFSFERAISGISWPGGAAKLTVERSKTTMGYNKSEMIWILCPGLIPPSTLWNLIIWLEGTQLYIYIYRFYVLYI